SEARAMIAAISAKYGRTIEPDVIAALLRKRVAGKVAWGNALWLSLATEELNLLDADDFQNAQARFSGTPVQRLIKMMIAVVQKLPADIAGVYRSTFESAEERFGGRLVQAFLALLAVSRAGLRELELRDAIGRITGAQPDALALASLRRFFRAQLRQRRTLGEWDFSHPQMRLAVRTRLSEQRVAPKFFHAALADSLLALPAADPMREREAMVHLLGSEQWSRAGAHLTDKSLSQSSEAAAAEVLTGMLLGAEGAPGDALGVVSNLLETDPELAANVACVLLYRPAQSIKGRAAQEIVLGLLSRIRKAIERATARRPDNTLLQRDLAACLSLTGNILLAQGKSSEAIDLLRLSVRTSERIASKDTRENGIAEGLRVGRTMLGNALAATGRRQEALQFYRANAADLEARLAQAPNSADLLESSAVAWGGIGDAAMSGGDLDGALQAYRRSLSLAEPGAHAGPHRLRNLAVTLDRLGDILAALRRDEEAEAMYRREVEIAEDLAAADPANLELLYDLQSAREHLGSHLLRMGRPADARASFEACAVALEKLTSASLSNVVWQAALAVNMAKLGNVCLALGQAQQALSYYERGYSITARLARLDRNNHERQRDLAVDANRLGMALQALRRSQEAMARFEESLAISERLAAANTSNLQWTTDVATNLFQLARVNADLGNENAANRHLRASIKLRERLVQAAPRDPGGRFALAVDLAALADFDRDARALRKRARDILVKLDAEFGLSDRQRSLLDSLDANLRR
ncbi:MAG: tetratricopeptide repeat protein, partial [Terricaulis sp.]